MENFLSRTMIDTQGSSIAGLFCDDKPTSAIVLPLTGNSLLKLTTNESFLSESEMAKVFIAKQKSLRSPLILFLKFLFGILLEC